MTSMTTADLEQLVEGTFKNNNFPAGIPALASDPSSLALDPQLAGPLQPGEAEGYRLKLDSPCRGVGLAAPEASSDFWCAPRSSTKPSIGIHEG